MRAPGLGAHKVRCICTLPRVFKMLLLWHCVLAWRAMENATLLNRQSVRLGSSVRGGPVLTRAPCMRWLRQQRADARAGRAGAQRGRPGGADAAAAERAARAAGGAVRDGVRRAGAGHARLGLHRLRRGLRAGRHRAAAPARWAKSAGSLDRLKGFAALASCARALGSLLINRRMAFVYARPSAALISAMLQGTFCTLLWCKAGAGVAAHFGRSRDISLARV